MIYVLTNEKLSNAFIPIDIGITYIDTIDQAVSYCEDKLELGVDTETTGLDFFDNKVVMFQIGDLDNQFLIDTRYYSIEPFREILESTKITKVLQNAKFDYKFIRKAFSIRMENVYDTMLAEKVITCGDNRYSPSLFNLAGKYLGKQISKDAQTSFINHSGPFRIDQIIYGADDVTLPLEIKEAQQFVIKKEGLENTVKLENKAVLAFGDIEFEGIAVNKEKWLENASKVKENLDALENSMIHIIETEEQFKKFQMDSKQLDFFKPAEEISYVNVNWGSPKQVLEIFKTVHPKLKSVGAPVLNTLDNKHDIVLKYMDFKKQSKLYQSYGPAFLEHIKSDGKVHTIFNQILQTGRVSSSKPNMQQIPASNDYRNCFIAGRKGWSFVSSDFSSQELCVIATISNDPVWLKALQQGKDLHSVCAALVFGDVWKDAADEDCAFYKKGKDSTFDMKKCSCKKHKKLRDGVKAINFGLAYGMSEFALADRMRISVEEAIDLINTYFTTFPKIKEALERFGEFGKKYGYIMTMPPFKRKRYFPTHKFIDSDKSVAGTIERASKNTPIQGSSADMTKLAMIMVRDYIHKFKVPVFMVMTVHDQIDTIARDDYKDAWKLKLNELMEKAALKIITNGLLKAETEISPVWKK